MKIHPPSSDELRALARELGLDLSESELEVYRNLIAGSLGAFAASHRPDGPTTPRFSRDGGYFRATFTTGNCR
jgi:hypothetical protein